MVEGAPEEMAFFFYDSKSRRLAQRIDTWSRTTDGSGQWVLETQPVLDIAAITQRFDASGLRLDRIDADGTVTQRIDPQALQRLWRSKGLTAR